MSEDLSALQMAANEEISWRHEMIKGLKNDIEVLESRLAWQAEMLERLGLASKSVIQKAIDIGITMEAEKAKLISLETRNWESLQSLGSSLDHLNSVLGDLEKGPLK